jgi:hypothetical protein
MGLGGVKSPRHKKVEWKINAETLPHDGHEAVQSGEEE